MIGENFEYSVRQPKKYDGIFAPKEILEWCEQELPDDRWGERWQTMYPEQYHWYFRDKADMTLFVLRWIE